MQVSLDWLREWLPECGEAKELAHRLTMAGLEVGAIETAAPPFRGVVVGHVTDCGPHPDAEKLRVCVVDTGDGETSEIVCGAPNVRQGLKVAVAQVGARLPGGVKIRKAKLRGVASAGMICSARELGLGDEHDGILELPEDAPLGRDFRQWLALDDEILELELTPNRGDCLGMRGVAREVAALLEQPVDLDMAANVAASSDASHPVEIEAPDGCGRFASRVVTGIDPAARSPLWLCERLRRAGIRSLGPVVDVTNYVMLETGLPMHGFDLATLKGAIRPRWAADGEKLTLLDGREVELQPDVLVIADDSGARALAGIMGGENSGVSDTTRDVFFECAWFAPLAIAGRARRFGLHTDASHRFERGVDPSLQEAAIERATELLISIAGGKAGPLNLAEEAAKLPRAETVSLRAARVTRLLGKEIDAGEIEGILTRLGFEVSGSSGEWKVTAPPHRFDISLEEDLIEEIARVHGYDHIAPAPERPAMTLAPATESRVARSTVVDALAARGYREVITYSFVDPVLHETVLPEANPLALANPISADLAVMRTSLLPGLLQCLQYNQAHQKDRIRIFESGLTYVTQDSEIIQKEYLGIALTGSRLPPGWEGQVEAADFHDLAGDILALAGLGGLPVALEPAEIPALHPGQSAHILVDGQIAGSLGALHPGIQQKLEIEDPVLLCELEMAPAFAARPAHFEAVSRFPSLRRDLAVIVDESITAADLCGAAQEAAPTMVKSAEVFDIYRGEGIDSGRKSVALGLILQDSSRTLTDSHADAVMADVMGILGARFNAKIRD